MCCGCLSLVFFFKFTFVCSYCVCIFFLFISGPIQCVTLEPFSFRIWIQLHHRPLPGLFLSLVWLLCAKEWSSLLSFCSLLLAASYKFEYMLKIWFLSSLLTVDTVLFTFVCLYSSWITFSDSFKEYLALLLLQLCWSFPWKMLSFPPRFATELGVPEKQFQLSTSHRSEFITWWFTLVIFFLSYNMCLCIIWCRLPRIPIAWTQVQSKGTGWAFFPFFIHCPVAKEDCSTVFGRSVSVSWTGSLAKHLRDFLFLFRCRLPKAFEYYPSICTISVSKTHHASYLCSSLPSVQTVLFEAALGSVFSTFVFVC